MHDLPLLTTIATGFAAAWILGILTHRVGLSPIVGYLLAGVVIGPHTPGFVGDVELAHQLAEIGVILLMFGVGLHFRLKDLMAVRRIAIPGAIVQITVATTATMLIFHHFGWSWRSSLVMGMAMSVASTVVLVRVLTDRRSLDTPHGHAAVGWLIVEDIFTVVALVLVPMLALRGASSHVTEVPATLDEAVAALHPAAAIAWSIGKLMALVAVVLLAGSRIVPWVLLKVARLRSHELFTLTVLVVSVTIAVGSAYVFGASVALGAFLAGMVVGQSPVSHQAASDALPMRDAFTVLFFVSVGMLFDPAFLFQQPGMVAAGLAIVLVAKPLAALVIVAILGHSVRTALTVALGLAQIGEFSFIMATVAAHHGLMPDAGHQVLVATAILSITLNPLLFRAVDPLERRLRASPLLWRLLNGRCDRMAGDRNLEVAEGIAQGDRARAIIVGYGPVGRVVDALVRDGGLETVIIDLNVDTVQSLVRSGRKAIYGDASSLEVLEQAGIREAVHIVVTLNLVESRVPVVRAARGLNPGIEITVRAGFISERATLDEAGANKAITEEGEVAVAMARHVMRRRSIDERTIDRVLKAIRTVWAVPE